MKSFKSGRGVIPFVENVLYNSYPNTKKKIGLRNKRLCVCVSVYLYSCTRRRIAERINVLHSVIRFINCFYYFTLLT